jgi:hypothetical protein
MNKKQSHTANLLSKYDINSLKISADKIVMLAEYIQKEWDIVKKDKVLTTYLIQQYNEHKNIDTENLMIKNKSLDTFIEDTICALLKAYIIPDTRLHLKSNFALKISVKKQIILSDDRPRNKPYILIESTISGKAICILEFKENFTRGNFSKIFEDSYSQWRKLNPNVFFLFIIFNSSKQKSEIIRQIDNCKVICNDFNLLKNNNIEPEIIHSVEQIFEDIHLHVIKSLLSGK